MPLFIDTFTNKVDRKGRVSVPAPFRSALAGQNFHGIVALCSTRHPAIRCSGIDWIEDLVASIDNVDLFSEAHDDLTASLLGDTKQLPFDGEGRVMLPASFCQYANIADLAGFLGRGRSFEIREPSALERYKAEARRRAQENGHTVPPRPDRPR